MPRANLKQVTIENDCYVPVGISQAIVHNGIVYVSGQTAYNEAGEFEGGDFEQQADRSFRNLKRVLEAAGTGLENVIKVSIFLKDMQASFATVVKLRKTYFTPPYPADTICEIKALWRPDVLFEIEAIAALPTTD